MAIITRTQLARVAPHAAAHIVAAIVDHADDVLPRYGLATAARLPDFLAHLLVESAGLTRVDENLSYTAARLVAVWPSRFPTAAAAAPYAHNPRALADKVYGGRMGNTGPDDGWLNRGQGLIQTTGHDNIARLAAHLRIGFEAARAMLTSEAGMLEAAAATYVMLGAPAYADKGDIVGSTRAVNGGATGLADRRTALALCRKVWPRVVAPTHTPAAAALPITPPVPPAVLPSTTQAPEAPVPSYRMLALVTLFLGLFGAGAAQAAEAVAVSPVINDAISFVAVPALLALLSGGGVGAILVVPLKRFIDQKTADVLAKRVDELLARAIAYGAKQAEAYVTREDFHLNVDGWIQELAAKYALAHAPALLKQAGGVLSEKIEARLASHEDVLALKSRAANDNVGAPLQLAGAAA